MVDTNETSDTAIRECDRVSATVVSIDDLTARVSLDGGAEGVLQRADLPRKDEPWPIAVGEKFEVWVDQKIADGEFMVSKTKAEKLALWDRIEAVAETGEVIEGEILSVVKGGLSVDIGLRGFLPASQVELRQVDDLSSYVGQKVELVITRFNKRRGNCVLSRRPVLERERQTRGAETLDRLEIGQQVDGRVVSLAKYGAFVDLGGIDGLVHNDELAWTRVNHPSQVVAVGGELRVEIIDIDRDKQRISLSRKALLEDPWAEVAEKYPVGEKLTREVVSLTDYGAFVRLEEGIEGLVHVTELSWSQRNTHPKNLVKVGAEIEVVVLDIDEEQRRISLSHKQALPNPWDIWAEKYGKGTRVRGTVRRFTDFGIFVELEEGLDGLLRLGDISWTERGKDAAAQYSEGDEIELVVLDCQPAEQRLALSVKHLTDDPWLAIAEKYPVGTRVKAKVTNVVEFGAFLELEEGVEGLCHISQLSTERVNKPSDVLKPEQETEVMVIGMDVDKRKISLSIKALTEGFNEEGDYRKLMKEQEEQGGFNTLGDALSKVGISSSDESSDVEKPSVVEKSSEDE